MHLAGPRLAEIGQFWQPLLVGGDQAAGDRLRIDERAKMAERIDPGRWDDWPWSLLDIVPAATGAAWDQTPSAVIWHFQS